MTNQRPGLLAASDPRDESLIGHCSLSNPTGVLRNHHFDVSSYSNEKFGFPEVSWPGLYVYSRAAAGPNARQSLRETKTYDS